MMQQTITQQKQEQNEKEIFDNFKSLLKVFNRELVQINSIDLKESKQQMRLSFIKILEVKISEWLQNENAPLDNFQKQWTMFQQELQVLLINEEENSLSIDQQINSFIQQFLDTTISQKQTNQIVEAWQIERLSNSYLEIIYKKYNIESLFNIPGIMNIVALILFSIRSLNQFDFYHLLLNILVLQEINKGQNQEALEFENSEIVLQKIEKIIVDQIIYQNNRQGLRELMQQSNLQFENLLKQQHIIDFFIARHFNTWLLKISEDYSNNLNNQINTFLEIRNQSKIGKINLKQDDFVGSINYLIEKYESSQNFEIRLIKLAQASALIDDFQQEAGNAFTILSYLQSTIWNQNFQNIKVANSLLNNIQFFSCNFNQSIMNNVSIVTTQFIQCQLQNVLWQNLESSCLNVFNNVNYALFSTNKSILIQILYNDEIIKISYLNLLTGKQIKFFCNQIMLNYQKDSFKLQCQRQILVFFNKTITYFWSLQVKKQIRAYKQETYPQMLSPNRQVAMQAIGQEINLWKIYENDQNMKIKVQGLDCDNDEIQKNIKFSKDGQVLILRLNGRVTFWRVSDGKQLCKNIDCLNVGVDQVKFSPGRKLLAVVEDSGDELAIWDVENEIRLYAIKQNCISQFKFSSDGEILVFQTFDWIFYYTIKDQQLLQNCNYLVWNYYGEQKKFQFLDTQTLFFSYENKIIFSSLNQKKQFYCLEDHISEFDLNLVYSDKSYLISSSRFTSLTYLWNLKNYQKYLNNEYNAIWQNPSYFALSPNGESIGLMYSQLSFQTRSLDDLRIVHQFNFDQQNPLSQIISPDFKKIAYFSNNQIFVQNIENQKIIQVKKMEEGMQLLKFSDNGLYIAGYYQQFGRYILNVWHVEDEEKNYSHVLKTHQIIHNFEFSKDGKSFAVGLDCRSDIMIVNIDNQETKYLKNEKDPSSAMAFSSNGELLAIGNLFFSDYCNEERKITYEIRIWNIFNGNIIQRLGGHEDYIVKMVFLQDAQIIISTSKDCTIRIWNIQKGQQIQVLSFSKSNKIVDFSISLDGQIMITKFQNGLMQLWSTDDNQKYQKLIRQKNNIKKRISQDLENNQNNQVNVGQKNQYHFTLCKIIGNKRFQADQCLIDGSLFFSTEGYNLNSVFKEKSIAF